MIAIAMLATVFAFFACTPAPPEETQPAAEEPAQVAPPAGEEAKPESGETPAAAEPEAKAAEAAPARADEPARPKVNPLLTPNEPIMNQKAPPTFQVKFETPKGTFVVQAHRDWAPHGVDRFYNLVRHGFYDECRFFRVLSGFVAQFGISGDPTLSSFWRQATIPDDPVKTNNTRGRLTFATAGPGSRTTQLFINYKDNSGLDSQGFSPIGEVIQGMEVVDALYADYGEGAPSGKGPRQDLIQTQGNRYLKAQFPRLDYVKKATIIE